ncbi:MAG: hypothetical protein R2883_02900 [Caldisericia bacterium]
MKYVRIIVTTVVCLGFLVFAFLIRDDFITERIQAELTSHSILEYRSGASVYIAEEDNNSKVYFGRIGSSEIFGSGALAWDEKANMFTSGLRIKSDNKDLVLPKLTDVLSLSISPNSKYLAAISIDGSMEIFDLSVNEKTFTTSSNQKVDIKNPFEFGDLTAPPYVFFCGERFVFSMAESEEIYWGIPQKINSQIVTVDPKDGSISNLLSEDYDEFVFEIMGKIDNDHLLVHMKPSDLNSMIKPDIASIHISDGNLMKLNSQLENIIGYSKRTESIYFVDDEEIYSKKIFPDKISENRKRVEIKSKATDEINFIILNSRITSNGYIFHQTPNQVEHNILLDPKTEIPAFLDKQRIPY